MTRQIPRIMPFGADFFTRKAILPALVFALIVHAVWIDVVIHPFFYSAHCIVPLLIPGGLLGAFVYFRMVGRAAPMTVDFNAVIALVVLPVIAAPLFWLFFGKTVSWTGALLLGEAHSEVRAFEIRDARGSKGCSGRAVVVDDLRLFPANLCVSGDYAAQYDRQRVRLRLSGQRTRLGFRITHFEHVASP